MNFPNVKTYLACLFLSIPDINCWSPHSLRQLLHGALDSLKDVLPDENSVTGKERTEVKRFKREIRQFFQYQPKDENILKNFYNTILASENMGILAGFGLATKFGDTINCNPEATSIWEYFKTQPQ